MAEADLLLLAASLWWVLRLFGAPCQHEYSQTGSLPQDNAFSNHAQYRAAFDLPAHAKP